MKLTNIFALLAAPLLVAAKQTIINGTDVEARQYPFMVSLQSDSHSKKGEFSHTCGGTLINKQQFLTAAHCLNHSWVPPGMEKDLWPHVPNWRARVGSDQHAEGGSLLNLSALHVHPLYTTRVRYDPVLNDGAYWAVYDIALVTLAEPVDASITPAELPLASQLPQVGSAVTVVGWGLNVSEKGELVNPQPRTLQQLTKIVEKPELCGELSNKYGMGFYNSTLQMCTVAHNGRSPSRAAMGDSGGPVLFGNTVVGVVSYVLYDFPTLDHHTTVSSALPWIEAFKLPLAG